MSKLTHINKQGEAHMVDISAKTITHRTAVAQSIVRCSDAVMQLLIDGSGGSAGSSVGEKAANKINNHKGDVFAAARIAGIQGAKKCSDLIPLCHPLPLSKVVIDIRVEGNRFVIESTCKTDGKTGVEMEALVAASVAALTIYDMCKAVDKGIVIESTRLISKTGGKSGDYQADGSYEADGTYQADGSNENGSHENGSHETDSHETDSAD